MAKAAVVLEVVLVAAVVAPGTDVVATDEDVVVVAVARG
jgi:hypothetical protein